jgi:hypothetical protein
VWRPHQLVALGAYILSHQSSVLIFEDVAVIHEDVAVIHKRMLPCRRLIEGDEKLGLILDRTTSFHPVR